LKISDKAILTIAADTLKIEAESILGLRHCLVKILLYVSKNLFQQWKSESSPYGKERIGRSENG
jgi:hypothetical protein